MWNTLFWANDYYFELSLFTILFNTSTYNPSKRTLNVFLDDIPLRNNYLRYSLKYSLLKLYSFSFK